jgi:hypothetical protein
MFVLCFNSGRAAKEKSQLEPCDNAKVTIIISGQTLLAMATLRGVSMGQFIGGLESAKMDACFCDAALV